MNFIITNIGIMKFIHDMKWGYFIEEGIFIHGNQSINGDQCM